MADKKYSWRRFQRMNFSTKSLSSRAKKAETATVRHARKFIFERISNVQAVRRHIVGWTVLVGFLIAVAALQLLWFQRSYMITDAPAEGGTYAEAALGPINTLNPLYASTIAERSAARLMFSSLYSYDHTGQLSGDLAETMTVSDDGTEYVIKIRDDVRWSDGRKLTSADVVFTAELIQNPMTRSVVSGWQNVDVKAVDEYSLKFTLPTAYAPFDDALTFPIVPKHILDTVDPSTLREASFSQSPVGSGPFELRLNQTVNMTKDHKIIHLAANPDYYQGNLKLEKFQLHVYGDYDAIARALRVSEVNAAANIPMDLIPSSQSDRYKVASIPVNNGVYTMFNTENETLKDIKVRRALRLATDTNAIRANSDYPLEKLDLPFLKYQVAEVDLPSAPAHNPSEAGKLLDKAGWKLNDDGVREKSGKPLELTITSLRGAEYEAALETLARQWREVGVVVNSQVLDAADANQDILQTVLQPRNYEVLIYELNLGGDADQFAYWHSSQTTRNGLNFANYSNDVADDALASARSRIEPDLRAEKYRVFAKQWLEDVPAIGLYQSNMYYVKTGSLNSIDEDSTSLVNPGDRYHNIMYWTVRQGSVYKTP